MTAPLDETPSGRGMPDVQATFCATLVDEWIARGLRRAIVAPGSRSTPMALALASRAELDVAVFHDERSAAFAALGSAMADGIPAVVLCTSGTAAANLHPAVIEAHLSGVPVLVVTADRPAELRDVSAPQTIDQTHLFGRAARWFHDPGSIDWASRATWRSLAGRSFDAAVGVHPGPVHLNLPFREPLVGTAGEPEPTTGRSFVSADAILYDAHVEAVAERLDVARGVIVAGRGCGDPAAVEELAAALQWPVLADPLSGCTRVAGAVTVFDSMLRHGAFSAAHLPEVVLRLGRPPASRVLAEWVAASRATVVQVTGAPVVVDPDHRVTVRVAAEPTSLCRALAGRFTGRRPTPWAARWRHAAARAGAAIDATLVHQGALSEPAVARATAHALPLGSSLVVSSSMPIRDVEWFADVPAGLRVFANRGANGIDGVVSTAVGVALATRAPTGVLIGDIAFVHDSSGLAALPARGVDLRVVVIDNSGGGIFSFLPQATTLPPERFEELFGTPHGVDVAALAEACGVRARTVGDVDELSKALAEPGPFVLRASTDRAANVSVHRDLNAAVSAALDERP